MHLHWYLAPSTFLTSPIHLAPKTPLAARSKDATTEKRPILELMLIDLAHGISGSAIYLFQTLPLSRILLLA